MGLRRDVPLPDVNPDPLLNQRLGRTLFQQENELAQDESRCWGVVLSEIFISYRRADSRSEARSIYERMVRSYGVRKVFMDVEGIERGASFTKVLKQELERAKVLVAIIGPHWAGDGGDASTRLFDGADFVRTEIQIALHRKIPIIPILVNGALMPDKRLVPDCLHPLLSKNAATLTYNNFASDIGAVDRQISKWVRPLRKTYRVVSATAALVVMTSFAFYLYYASAGRNNTLVSIGDLSTIPSPDSELEWLKIKIERNFVDLFADNGVPVTHRSLGHPPVGRSSMRINGVVERLASGEVGVQILLEHPHYRVRSVSHNAPLELWTEAYKSIPAAILFAVYIDPKTTQPKASSKRTSMSFKASLLYLEAVRLAKAPQLMRALALIERAIAEDEKFAVAYWVKAQILRGLGRESEAATVESIATSIDPDHARPIIVGEPTKPLPSLFQRLQHTDWTHIERGMLYKRVEQESYGITLHAWSFLLDAYHLGVVMASNPLGATA
jgi:hypothetical protein